MARSKLKKEIKRQISAFGKKHNEVREIYQHSLLLHRKMLYYKQARKTKVDDHTILFTTFMGRNYSCSPRAIFEEMQRREMYDYTYVWVFRKYQRYEELTYKYKNVIIVRYGSPEFYYYMARAKYWVTNSRILDAIPKRKEQVLIQCWHGTPLKRIGLDVAQYANAIRSTKNFYHLYKHDSEMYDYLISPSAFCTEKFTSAFGLQERPEIILEIGYPRNDALFNFDDIKVIATKYNIGIPQDKKVILYAPTWRDDQHEAGKGYTYKNQMDLDLMMEHFGDEYVILYRTHYFVANKLDLSKYKGFVYNVSSYDDINDLYIISDMLITDYSSVFFDYADLRRPILFYMYDLEDYKTNLRDFYIDLSELPGPIAQTQEELIKEIEEIDQFDEKYHDAYAAFNAKFNYLDDGHAAGRAIDRCILNKE